MPRQGTINLHGGHLPYYRGGSPLNWQIIRGESQGGCAIIYVDEGIDTGDLIAQELYDITPDMTAGEALELTLSIFPAMLVRVVDAIRDGTVARTPQDLPQGAYYRKRYPRDGDISWDRMDDGEVHNLVRALNGPGLAGAFSFLDGNKITFWRTKRLNEDLVGEPGTVVIKRHDGVVVACRNRGLLVTEMLIDGKAVPAGEVMRVGQVTNE